MMGCVPPVAAALPAVGDAYGGGYFVGQLTISGAVYNIIVAAKPDGQNTVSMKYKTDTVNFTGASSTNDGILIRNNMIAAGISQFPAQQWCNALTLGGFTDWYLPTKDEMELAYRMLKPTTAVNVTTSGKNPSSIPPRDTFYTTTDPAQTGVALFKSGAVQAFAGDYYNCATAGTASAQYMLKRMTTGADYSEGYAFEHWVRAFRRELAA